MHARYCIVHFSLYISGSQRTSGTQETIYKHYEYWQILDNFSCQELWTFWTTFWLAFDFGSNRIWEISEPYTSVQDPSRPRKFRSSDPVRVKNAKNRYIFLKLRMCMIPTYVSNMAYNSFELLQILDLITVFSKEIVLFYFKH